VKEWREVQALIGKTGKESLKRRVSEFDVDKLPLSLAGKVKDLLKNYNHNEIRDTSHGAATFYVWVRSRFAAYNSMTLIYKKFELMLMRRATASV